MKMKSERIEKPMTMTEVRKEVDSCRRVMVYLVWGGVALVCIPISQELDSWRVKLVDGLDSSSLVVL